MRRGEVEKRYALRRGDDGGGAGGHRERFEPRGAREWGGRVGARLEELDAATRSALREAGRAVRRRHVATTAVVPVVAVLIAFSVGLLLARRFRDRSRHL